VTTTLHRLHPPRGAARMTPRGFRRPRVTVGLIQKRVCLTDFFLVERTVFLATPNAFQVEEFAHAFFRARIAFRTGNERVLAELLLALVRFSDRGRMVGELAAGFLEASDPNAQ